MAGHVERMSEERVVNRLYQNTAEGSRSVGRPRLMWLDDVREDLRRMGVTNWRICAHRRLGVTNWRIRAHRRMSVTNWRMRAHRRMGVTNWRIRAHRRDDWKMVVRRLRSYKDCRAME